MSDEEDNRRRGLFTSTDKKWLNGEGGGSKQKYDTKKAMAKAIKDIKDLVNLDTSKVTNLNNISELFEHIEDQQEWDRKEAAKYLITLAYIITNEPIDYAQIAENSNLHPRNEDESVGEDENRPEQTSLVQFNQPVLEMLAFRGALVSGIRQGKMIVDGDTEEADIPELVTVDVNTTLYKEPTEDRLMDGFTADDWRDVYAQYKDMYNRWLSYGVDLEDISGTRDSVPDKVKKQEAIENLILELRLTVDEMTVRRRKLTNENIRNISMPGHESGIDGFLGVSDYGGQAISVQRSVYEAFEEYKDGTDLDDHTEAIAHLLEEAGKIKNHKELLED